MIQFVLLLIFAQSMSHLKTPEGHAVNSVIREKAAVSSCATRALVVSMVRSSVVALFLLLIAAADLVHGFSCPRYCSYRGICLTQGKCTCPNTWTGCDCSVGALARRTRVGFALYPMVDCRFSTCAQLCAPWVLPGPIKLQPQMWATTSRRAPTEAPATQKQASAIAIQASQAPRARGVSHLCLRGFQCERHRDNWIRSDLHLYRPWPMRVHAPIRAHKGSGRRHDILLH